VTAYAICAPRPPGYVIPPFGESVPIGELPNGSNSPVIASVTFPGDTSLLSAGAALGSDAPGHVALQAASPAGGVEGTPALAAENTPTDTSWGFMVASAICAS
jgi:hypothetical protein